MASEPETVRQILEYVGDQSSARATALAWSPPLEMKIVQQMDAPEVVFVAIANLSLSRRQIWQRKLGIIGWWRMRLRMRSRSRNWSLIRHCGSNPA